MAISSTGLGSGLDVTSIISQLSALEKQPLKALQSKATTLQTQLSTVGIIQSQVSTLSTAAAKLGSVLSWKGTTATSSNTAAVAATAGTGAAAASYSIEVSKLAKAQSLALPTAVGSPALPASTDQLGYGTLTIQVGSNAAVNINIADGEGTLAQIAAKINAVSGLGVAASVISDGSGKVNLMLRATNTGTDGAFTVTATEGTGGTISVPSILSRLSYATGNFAMAQNQAPQNAEATINGVAVTSSKNTLTNVVDGLSLTLSQVTTTAVDVTVGKDTAGMTKNIQDFISAYNALNQTLNDATAYDAATKTAGPLQGDSVANGLQRALRSLVGATSATGSTFTRLADVGISAKLGGDLELNSTRLTSAFSDVANLQLLFTNFGGSDATNGFGLRVKDFANGLLAAAGTVSNKTSAVKKAIDLNSAEQTKVNTRATNLEARLKAQYSALDTKMAGLTALNSYVAQQVTTWNRSTS
ncbi:flagellar filament capping protein FliD [Rhodoferax sp.]|uniref:flagellar filament capping protein FliD n=1 Tax=Rhodoferax sp. TaxID=50421 RepID=UPI0025D974C2|nr:flagellar filament capping protein FliD [Rhodoferax sp.]